MKEILTIHVLCTQTNLVHGGKADAAMVLFEGTAEGPYFSGAILPGGCDTQRIKGSDFRLSARYMLQGTDCEGAACRIFIENSGRVSGPPEDGVIRTTPEIVTDSPALRRYEGASLSGTVTGEGENRVLIRVFAEDEA